MPCHAAILRHLPPRFWADLLDIAWRLLLPVLALAVLLQIEPWLEPLPPVIHPRPAAASQLPAAVELGNALSKAFGTMMLWLLLALGLGALLIVQAFWSPLPSYRRYLHGRAWRFVLPGVLVGAYWLSPLADPVWSMRYYLASGVLVLGLPGLIEWLTAPRPPAVAGVI